LRLLRRTGGFQALIQAGECLGRLRRLGLGGWIAGNGGTRGSVTASALGEGTGWQKDNGDQDNQRAHPVTLSRASIWSNENSGRSPAAVSHLRCGSLGAHSAK
jgi:hypothetical protein